MRRRGEGRGREGEEKRRVIKTREGKKEEGSEERCGGEVTHGRKKLHQLTNTIHFGSSLMIHPDTILIPAGRKRRDAT